MTATAAPDITVVGIGADGWAGLGDAARAALDAAEVLLGSARQLALLPASVPGTRLTWPSPLLPAIGELAEEHRGRRVCVLASGDPMFHGIGATLVRLLGPDRVAVLPHPSSVSLAAARLRWRLDDTEIVSLVTDPVAVLHPLVHPGRRLLVLSAGAQTPALVAGLLAGRGFGGSRITVLEQLGGPRERLVTGTAARWAHPPGDPLNVVAVECRADPNAVLLSTVAGLPDAAYDHDGQLTKREIRAVTLAHLAPLAGELLWDVGAGSGSIAIEWSRGHRACRAVAVEADPVRAARIARNATALGTPGLSVVTGQAPDALAGLAVPDAVFVGGGVTRAGVLEACWSALRPGGRLVVNAVTMESEQVLARWYGEHGGELTRMAVNRAAPLGGFTGWRAMMPVTMWAVTRP